MVEGFVDKPESVLQSAVRLGIHTIASVTLMQGQVLSHLPAKAAALPVLSTDAQRAIQFTRSTPGISVALVGMSRREHVIENLGVARVTPVPADEYPRFYQ